MFSRDVFLHIHDKPRLLDVIHRALKPGGKLLFTDYCCGPPPWGEDFSTYVRSRGYDLHTVKAYAELLEGAGFRRVSGIDWTDRFIEVLETELTGIGTLPLPPAERTALQADWRAKITRARSGDQRWGRFSALK